MVMTGQSGRAAAPTVSARARSRLRGKRRDLGISTAAGGVELDVTPSRRGRMPDSSPFTGVLCLRGKEDISFLIMLIDMVINYLY
jgi:hypothetical protein